MADKEKKDLSVKKATVMAVIAIILIFIAFAVLGGAALMQDDQEDVSGWGVKRTHAITRIISFDRAAA